MSKKNNHHPDVWFYTWIAIAAWALILAVIRTLRSGWFHGKDEYLFIILLVAILAAGRRWRISGR